jgi:hypothetical protein
MRRLSEKLGVKSDPLVFDGGHEIHEETLLRCVEGIKL